MPFPNYSIAGETNAGSILEDRLHREIVDEGPYTTTFLGVFTNHDADLLTVNFDAPPSPGDQAIIDAIVAAHVGNGNTDIRFVSESGPIFASDRIILTSAGLLVSITLTLPPATDFTRPIPLIVADSAGVLSPATTVTIQRSGADLINGLATTVIDVAFGFRRLISDQISSWTLI